MARIDPWGEEREDIRHAKLMAAIVAGSTREPQRPADWMPFREQDEADLEADGQDESDMRRMVESMFGVKSRKPGGDEDLDLE